jgi:uncharacterized protein YciI
MNLFLYRLIPPRARTFASDMTADEGRIMKQHILYWQEQAASGRVLVFGPVADPDAAFGIAVLVAEDGEDVAPLCLEDPAIKLECGFHYKLHPLPRYVLGRQVTL